MRNKAFTCTDCGNYAPPNGQGRPMWAGPRCTGCAAKRYATQTGCDPTQAERLMVEEHLKDSEQPAANH